MAIYDGNRTELDSLIIGDVVTVVIDAGEYVSKELKIKRCAVVGDDSELAIIEDFQVCMIELTWTLIEFRSDQCFLV